MGEELGILIFRVTSKGCANCIVPAKVHLIKSKGVLGVHVKGKYIIVIYDPARTTPYNIIGESGIQEYYRIHEIKSTVIKKNELNRFLKQEYILLYNK